jgi:hypothetical protein
MLMRMIQKVTDALSGKTEHDTLRRVEDIEQRHREVSDELEQVLRRTDRLRDLVTKMREPPDV